jgi:hypothetical protein
MWLINRLKPDFKTITDFRKSNNAARAMVSFPFIGQVVSVRSMDYLKGASCLIAV